MINLQPAGVGWTINDKHKSLISAGAASLLTSNPWLAELKAILLGMMEADSKGLSNFALLSDSLVVVSSIIGGVTYSDEYREIITECRRIISIRQGRIIWCPRDFLSAPDSLAKYARMYVVDCYWSSSFPIWLCNLNLSDSFIMNE